MATNIIINSGAPQPLLEQPKIATRTQTFKLYENEFSSGLFDCCSDCSNCLFAYFCFPFFECKTFDNAGVFC